MWRILKYLFFFLLFIALVLFALSFKSSPSKITYGVSFSKFHADELKLPWKDVYLGLLNDLKVRDFRFSAIWSSVEPVEGKYDWSEIDYEMQQADAKGAKVILGIGRRLPGWPECHEPEWEQNLSTDKKHAALLGYITAVVNRYKNSKSLTTWQVENEPYLKTFATFVCGPFDEDFFKQEIALVRKLDPAHPILVTDSGETGYWDGSYKAGDIFGTTMYLYVYSSRFGAIKYPIPPAFFRIRQNVSALLFGKKPTMLIELGAEPWLTTPIIDAPLSLQLSRMDISKFNEVLSFASKTAFDTQYLWGAEWWYYMRQNNHPEFWEKAKEIFR